LHRRPDLSLQGRAAIEKNRMARMTKSEQKLANWSIKNAVSKRG
jgi:hypothetical protein